jgi:hypothetical protein
VTDDDVVSEVTRPVPPSYRLTRAAIAAACTALGAVATVMLVTSGTALRALSVAGQLSAWVRSLW